jgi:hypothetical protein
MSNLCVFVGPRGNITGLVLDQWVIRGNAAEFMPHNCKHFLKYTVYKTFSEECLLFFICNNVKNSSTF